MMYVPGSSNVAEASQRLSAGAVGAAQPDAHGELAPSRMSSQTEICLGLNFTSEPSPR